MCNFLVGAHEFDFVAINRAGLFSSQEAYTNAYEYEILKKSDELATMYVVWLSGLVIVVTVVSINRLSVYKGDITTPGFHMNVLGAGNHWVKKGASVVNRLK